MKILVIDDEQPTLKMFTLLLGALGHEVLTAETGEEGIEKFSEHLPPLVLTDIKMPGMDGIEVLRSIKEIQPATEVIVITGHGDIDLAIKALNLDATDFINKPVRREALQEAINRASQRMEITHSHAAALTIRLEEDRAIISVRGTLNHASEASITEAFRHACRSRQDIVLDCAENTSINGAALSVLANSIRRCRAEDHRIAVAGLGSSFREVFNVMGIAKHAAMFDSLDDVRFS